MSSATLQKQQQQQQQTQTRFVVVAATTASSAATAAALDTKYTTAQNCLSNFLPNSEFMNKNIESSLIPMDMENASCIEESLQNETQQRSESPNGQNQQTKEATITTSTTDSTTLATAADNLNTNQQQQITNNRNCTETLEQPPTTPPKIVTCTDIVVVEKHNDFETNNLNDKIETDVIPEEDTISKSSDTSVELRRSPSTQDATDKPKSRLAERAKKKSWYNVLYPNYKSRSQDFKKLFKDLPGDERLIVDYSCALQREILAQGRLYVSKNYVCFHANIFTWETYVSLKWTEVTAITKEKTALVIPNAISISTAKDKYFFATFTSRDKSYLMLFRIWQNTLMNKPMLPTEMWQWVHDCYGDELGLTTDDDQDYIDPSSATVAEQEQTIENFVDIPMEDLKRVSSQKEKKSTKSSKKDNTTKNKKSSFFKSNKTNLNLSSTPSASGSDNKASDNSSNAELKFIKDTMRAKTSELTLESAARLEESSCAGSVLSVQSSSSSGGKKNKNGTTNFETKRKVNNKTNRQRDESLSRNFEPLPTDVSGSSDSDESNKTPFVPTAECDSTHEGRQLVHTILPINVDTLFQLLFSKNKFLIEYHAMRKTQDINYGEWLTAADGKKTRTVSQTVQLAASVGPKTSKVTEYQTMRECSKPQELYSIDVNSENGGIPYADSFCVQMHYCLMRTVDNHTMLSVHAQIKYKKSVWGVVKGFIEKNAWAGLEDHYTALLHALQSETCIPPAKGIGRRQRRGNSTQSRPPEDQASIQSSTGELLEMLPTPQLPAQCIPESCEIAEKRAEPAFKYKWLSLFLVLLLFVLIVLNVILLFKLWRLEERIDDDLSLRARLPNLASLKELPSTHQDWVDLLRSQEVLHETELKKWHKVLQTAIDLLKKVSVACRHIHKDDSLIQRIEQIKDEL